MPRDVFGHIQAGATPAWIEVEERPARWGGVPRGNNLGLRETENEPLVRGGYRPTPQQIARYRQRQQEKTDE